MSATTVRSLQRRAFPQHRADGTLTAFHAAEDGFPFSIARVFIITMVSNGGVRGGHAHRGCTQMLACIAGRVTVEVQDGSDTVTEALTDDGVALLIPPLLWNLERFEGPSTVLAVLCDELYDERDYIRGWEEFRALKAAERVVAAPPARREGPP